MYKFKSSKKFRLSEALPALILSAVLASALLLSSCAAGDDISPQRVENEQTEQAQQTERTETTDSAGGEQEISETNGIQEYDADAWDGVLIDSMPPAIRIGGEVYYGNKPGAQYHIIESGSEITPYEYVLELTEDRQYLGTSVYTEDWAGSDDVDFAATYIDGAAVYYKNFDSVLLILDEPAELDGDILVGYTYVMDMSGKTVQDEPRSAVKCGDIVYTSDRTGYRVLYLAPDVDLTASQMELVLTENAQLIGEISHREYPFEEESDGAVTNDEGVAGAKAYRDAGSLLIILEEPIERDGGYIVGYRYMEDERF